MDTHDPNGTGQLTVTLTLSPREVELVAIALTRLAEHAGATDPGSAEFRALLARIEDAATDAIG